MHNILTKAAIYNISANTASYVLIIQIVLSSWRELYYKIHFICYYHN